MKKIICLFILVAVLTGSWFIYEKNKVNNEDDIGIENETKINSVSDSSEIRAVWVNYNELAMNSVGGGNEEQFRQKITEIFNNAISLNLNRVIVQVRPYSDAFYKSSLFPATEYLSGTQGVETGYDALGIMVDVAHKTNLKIDAWINPYRVSYKNDINLLAENNPAKLWYNENNCTEDLFIIDKGIFYNPASQRVQKLILDGVREILSNYSVDGIHMDDYFYPVTDESIDSNNYNAYLQQGGKLTLAQWRRENVNSFVSGLYMLIKNTKPDALLTISPAGDFEKNMEEHYADVKLWCSNSGYVDIIMPQLYYGFENQNQPFEKAAQEWSTVVSSDSVRLCYGLSVYKWDKEDKFAASGINEWQNNNDITKRQIINIKTKKNYGGFSFYSYSYLFSEKLSENAKKEFQNVKSVL